MSDAASAKFLRQTMMAGGGALALFVGLAAAPALVARPADAQEIVVAPPSGAPMSFADLIERVRPAVVSISVRQSPSAQVGPSIEGLPPGFEEFFRGQPGRPGGQAPTALGSGFFVDQNGTIVTNHHVVEGAEEITVRTSDGRDLQAELVGSDEPTDIAVLRIRDANGRFPYVTFDESRHVRVGDWVVAVGNPFGLDGTATAGIVSAMGRSDAGSSAYVDYMQIDAPINRGNSGGPTFDLNGNVIGVNSAIFSPTGGNVGIGFAIPAETASAIVQQLLQNGRVTRGWLGVSVQGVDADLARSLGLDAPRGALVASVVPDSPAARAGLQQGDLVVSINGEDIDDNRDLTQRVGAAPIGTSARMVVLRDGARRTVNVRLEERPSEQVLAARDPQEQPEQAPPGVEQGALGLAVRPATAEDRERFELGPNDGGLVVTAVTPDSDLAQKGVRVGDIILRAGGQAVRTTAELASATEAAQRARRPLLLQIDGRAGRRFVAAETGGAG
ncbi:MAG: Do family serine endopeptidase [Hyphomonadaceae bacterium]